MVQYIKFNKMSDSDSDYVYVSEDSTDTSSSSSPQPPKKKVTRRVSRKRKWRQSKRNIRNNDEKKNNDAINDLLEEIIDKENNYDPIKDKLLFGIESEDRMKYTNEINKILGILKDHTVYKIDIIKCKLPANEKADLIELYDVLLSMRLDDPSYLKIKKDIYNKVKNPNNQYTEKELKIIDKLKHFDKRDQTILKIILNAELPDERKKIIFEKYLSVADHMSCSEERCKMMKWVNLAVKLPIKQCVLFGENKSKKNDGKKLYTLKKTLDNEFYGQESAKERIMEVVGSMLAGSSGKKLVAFEGPPGVGKTKFAQLLGKILKMPFHQISFGGVYDSSFIHGHGFTYIGSQPGQVAKGLIKMGVTNGIFFMDEVDKLGKDRTKDVSGSLLHVLDFEQNNHFEDHYFQGIPLDLSKMFFVLSLNDRKEINPILRNRLHFIKFNAYKTNDKIEIAKKHFIPKIMNNLQINKNDIIFNDNIIRYIVSKSEKEKGVRKLENDIIVIIERINVLRKIKSLKKKPRLSYMINNFKIPFKLTREDVDKLYTGSVNARQRDIEIFI